MTLRTRGLSQLVHQLVQVRFLAQDEVFLGFLHHFGRDPRTAVLCSRQLESRVSKPSEFTSQGWPRVGSHTEFQRLGDNWLPPRSMLVIEQLDTSGRSKSPMRSDSALILKALPPVMMAWPRGGVDAVVPHVVYATQDDALRKQRRPLGVARPQLAQNRDQGVADQRVDFVDHQHQRLVALFGPAGQDLSQRGVFPMFGQDAAQICSG